MRPEDVSWKLTQSSQGVFEGRSLERKHEVFFFKNLQFKKVSWRKLTPGSNKRFSIEVFANAVFEDSEASLPGVTFRSAKAEELVDAYVANVCNLAEFFASRREV